MATRIYRRTPGALLIIMRCGRGTVVGEDRAWSYLRVLVWGWSERVRGRRTIGSFGNSSSARLQ
jgi:hypothetical protein